MKNKCFFCGSESESVSLVETQYGNVYSCNDFIGCNKRFALNLVAENISDFHKGEPCKNVPEIKCSEGFCARCFINKS
jgi:radical SAM protein with 4Fe4S-binding SPASM domain